MGLRTYQAKLKLPIVDGEQKPITYYIKMRKSDAQSLNYIIKRAFNLKQYLKEIHNERTYESQVMFGEHKIEDMDGYLKALMDFAAIIDGNTYTKETCIGIIKIAKEIYEKYVPTIDKRKTEAEIAEENKKREEAFKLQQIENEKKNKLFEAEKIKLLKQYHYLEQDDNTGSKICAKNIRIELKREYPGHKFSVRKDSYSTVNVNWENGPSEKEVLKIINKYQYGHFNGMEDIYEYHRSDFNNVFGGCKYVFGHRTVTEDKYSEYYKEHLESYYGKPTYVTNYSGEQVINRPRNVAGNIKHLSEVSFYTEPAKTNPESTKNETAGVRINNDKNGVEIKFSNIPSSIIRDKLKDNNFRWSRFSKVWYHKKTDEHVKLANEIYDAYLNEQ